MKVRIAQPELDYRARAFGSFRFRAIPRRRSVAMHNQFTSSHTRQAVAHADPVGVVIVVPAFAEGDERDPPVVRGIVCGGKGAAPTDATRSELD
jgi:hypothetical protein